jgi:hypothetical protein
MTTEKILIQVGDETIELIGEEKSKFIAQRDQDKLLADKLKAEQEAEATAKAAAKAALLARLGSTADEAALLLG